MAVLAGVALAAARRRGDRRALGGALGGRGVSERRDLGALAVAGRLAFAFARVAARFRLTRLFPPLAMPAISAPLSAPVAVVVVAVCETVLPWVCGREDGVWDGDPGVPIPSSFRTASAFADAAPGSPAAHAAPVIALSATAAARIESRGLNGVVASMRRLPRGRPAACRESTTAGPRTVANTGRRAAARTATRSSATASKPGGTSAEINLAGEHPIGRPQIEWHLAHAQQTPHTLLRSLHRSPGRPHPRPRSRASRSSARCWMTRTDPGERPVIAATSSALNPPRTRSSTTSAWAGGSCRTCASAAVSPSSIGGSKTGRSSS